MKKQIALLATIIAASGFSAFGQDWVNLGTANANWVYDEFTTPGVGVYAGNNDVNVTILWAATGTSDQLPSVGTAFGLKNGAASNQVATNGVTSVGSANPVATITTMLASGWSIATNMSSGAGSAATGLVSTPTELVGTKSGAITPYDGGNDFELLGGTGVSSSSIEMILLAWNGSASSYTTASALGWSNPFTDQVGSSSSDPAGGTQQSGLLLNQFGVANVPEPTTLALAGLGGLSMLFLRRRKS